MIKWANIYLIRGDKVNNSIALKVRADTLADQTGSSGYKCHLSETNINLSRFRFRVFPLGLLFFD